MTASLFGVTQLLVTLAETHDAPAFFAKKIKRFKDLPLPSLGLATVGLLVSIITALLLPGKIYEYITTAAGILLLFNWFFIIISALRLLQLKMWEKIMSVVGNILLLAAICGTMLEKEIRPGLYVSIGVVVVIVIISILINRKIKKQVAS